LVREGNDLVVIARDQEHTNRVHRSRVPIVNTVVGEALTTGREALCGDLYREFPNTIPGRPYRSILAIPIKRRDGVVLGVVSIDSAKKYHFDGDVRNLVTYLQPYVALLVWSVDKPR
jgi:putative methionine-R-sulfoxide reductase with GAF domain